MDAVNCVFLICVCLQPASSHPAPSKKGGGVFNCLAEGKKIQFLTKKLPFLADFGRKMVFNHLSEAKKLNF